MKSIVKLGLVAAAGLFTASAFADTIINPNPSVAPLNSFYVSGDAGYGMLSTPDQNFCDPGVCPGVTGASHSTGSFAGGLNIAYNRALTQNVLVGGEFGYDYDGLAKYTEDFHNNSDTLKISSQDFHLLATGTYLFANGFNVFAKAGVAQVYQKSNWSDSTNVDLSWANTSDLQYHPMTAVGAGYQIHKLNIFVQYAHIFGKDTNNFSDLFNSDGTFTGTVSVDTFKAGLGYTIAI